MSEDNIVNVFRDRERVGTGEGMATYIEGHSRLARTAERRNFFDRELRLVDMIQAYFYEVQSSYLRFSLERPDLQKIIDLFQSMHHKLYKNPYLIVLGYVMAQTIHQPNCVERIRQLLSSTHQHDLSVSDVIRYYRLLSSNPNLRS